MEARDSADSLQPAAGMRAADLHSALTDPQLPSLLHDRMVSAQQVSPLPAASWSSPEDRGLKRVGDQARRGILNSAQTF